MNLKNEFLNLLRALNAGNAEYAVCGGLALAIHGVVRATEDIDLLVPVEQKPLVQEIAQSMGFWIPIADMAVQGKMKSGVEVRRISKAQGNDLISLDLIVVPPTLINVWKTRQEVSVEDVPCWVVSRDGLIRMKSAAGRPQDLADIERLTNGE